MLTSEEDPPEPFPRVAAAPDLTSAAISQGVNAVSQPLGRSAAVSALWLTGQKWIVRLSGFATIAILTRLIAPEEFGVVAAASAVLPFVLLLSDMGLTTYIVQADDVDSRTLSTGFWFSLAAGFCLAGIVALAAPLLAAAFNTPDSVNVIRGMALSVLPIVTTSVPTALLRRHMRFKALAIQATVAGVAAQAVAVILAFAHAGAWALVAQSLVVQTVMGVLAWRAAHWRPTREFSIHKFRTMARFGVQVVAVDAVAASRAAGEAAIISHTLGPISLGYLSIAQRLVQVAQDVGAAALVPVTTVLFARVRESHERLREGYVRALRIGYMAVAPLLTTVAVAADLMVPMLFGPGWEPSIPVAQALAIAAILVLGAMIDHGLHYGLGAPGRWFAYALVIDLLTLGTTYLLAPSGLTYVAVGFVIVALAATVARWFLVGALIGIRARRLASTFFLDLLPIAISAAVGLGVRELMAPHADLVVIVFVAMAIGITHLVVVRIVSRRVLADALTVLPIPDRLSIIRRLV